MANKRETISKLDLRLEARLHWFLAITEKTTMQVIHLTQKELVERWRMSEATLECWRNAPGVREVVQVLLESASKCYRNTQSV